MASNMYSLFLRWEGCNRSNRSVSGEEKEVKVSVYEGPRLINTPHMILRHQQTQHDPRNGCSLFPLAYCIDTHGLTVFTPLSAV